MKEFNISDPLSETSYVFGEVENFEKVNPIEKFKEITINESIIFDRFKIKTENILISNDIIEEVLLRNALKAWQEQYEKLTTINLPEKLFSVLESNSKNEQIKALKDIALTGEELVSFIIKAYSNYDFVFSQFKSEFQHNGLNEDDLPILVEKQKDNTIYSIGKTNLTDGQLSQAIDHRKGIMAKFLDRDDKWHCFFYTYKSLKGKEIAYKEGQPHLHFISHTWGLSREYVLQQLQSRVYKLPSMPHIDYYR